MRQEVQELVRLYQDNLFAAAFNVCKNAQDAEDVVQDTFIQYYTIKKEFDSAEQDSLLNKQRHAEQDSSWNLKEE